MDKGLVKKDEELLRSATQAAATLKKNWKQLVKKAENTEALPSSSSDKVQPFPF